MLQAEGGLSSHVRQALMLTFLRGHCTAATAALRNYLVMAILRR